MAPIVWMREFVLHSAFSLVVAVEIGHVDNLVIRMRLPPPGRNAVVTVLCGARGVRRCGRTGMEGWANALQTPVAPLTCALSH
jgi:hypothetical protein